MKTWIRKRLDISTKDLIYAASCCLTTGSRSAITQKIESIWDTENQKASVSFSVRTGFDLLLEALKFGQGDEVLISALTIPDMPEIIENHGLVPIPIDLTIDDLAPSVEKIEAAITTKTKAIVVAHLFGGIINLDKISEVAKRHHILLIEDCAQSFYSISYSGNPKSDVSMFSFGTIKTATALGGAIVIVRNNVPLANKMQKLYSAYPVQHRKKFLQKAIKYIFITFLSAPRIFPRVIKFIKRKNIDYDSYIHNLSRSFPSGNFFENIRKQPCFPLLKLLLYRLETYQHKTIEARIERGNYLLQNLPDSLKFPGQLATFQSYWAFPILATEPQKVMDILRENGFDATNKNSLQIVGLERNSDTEALQQLQNQIVFLPLYPEIPMTELNRIIKLLQKI